MLVENYDTKKFENYTSEEEQMLAEDFHKKRTAFLIFDNKIRFLQNSTMSHLEWAKSIGVEEEKFNEITRGYAMDNKIVFYKGNFDYDNLVISDAQKFANEIKLFVGYKSAKVFVGLENIGIGKVWPPKTFLFDV